MRIRCVGGCCRGYGVSVGAAEDTVCRWVLQRIWCVGGCCRGPVCRWVLQRVGCVGGGGTGSVYWRLQRLAHTFVGLLYATLTCMTTAHVVSIFHFSPCAVSS